MLQLQCNTREGTSLLWQYKCNQPN